MPAEKPGRAKYYATEDMRLVRSACLTLATYLGSFLDDLVVVGGLAPTLLIPQELLGGREPHVGTQDLDLGLSLALLEGSRYTDLVAHLRAAGFEPDVTGTGKPANHRWKHRAEGVTVDFLIAAPPPSGKVTAKTRVIEASLSAVLARGLPLAFRDRRKVSLTGRTLRGEEATRDVWVCGPGAFLVLKALAFRGRGENKDAYDLLYVLENFGGGIGDVSEALRAILDDEVAREAVAILRADFSTATSPGPVRAADFQDRSDIEFKADRVGAVLELLRLLAT